MSMIERSSSPADSIPVGRPRLYTVVASHPALAVELMLAHKGLDYERIELPAGLSRVALRALRFPRRTVPALSVDGLRFQGSRQISRALDRIEPEPPLFPRERAARAEVEEAEVWGERLQNAVRRIELWGLAHDRSGVRAQLDASELQVPPKLGLLFARPTLRYLRRVHLATDEAVERDLAELPSLLDQVDRWIEQGLLGSAQPNAADFQIAPSVRLLMTMEDIRPLIEVRPSGAFAMELLPTYPALLSAGALLPIWR